MRGGYRLLSAVIVVFASCNETQSPSATSSTGQNQPAELPQADPYAPWKEAPKRLEAYQTVQVSMHRNKAQHLALKALLDGAAEEPHDRALEILNEMAANLEPIQGVKPWETSERNKVFLTLAAESLKTTRKLQKERWDRPRFEGLYDRLVTSCNECHDAFQK